MFSVKKILKYIQNGRTKFFQKEILSICHYTHIVTIYCWKKSSDICNFSICNVMFCNSHIFCFVLKLNFCTTIVLIDFARLKLEISIILTGFIRSWINYYLYGIFYHFIEDTQIYQTTTTFSIELQALKSKYLCNFQPKIRIYSMILVHNILMNRYILFYMRVEVC